MNKHRENIALHAMQHGVCSGTQQPLQAEPFVVTEEES